METWLTHVLNNQSPKALAHKCLEQNFGTLVVFFQKLSTKGKRSEVLTINF